MKKTNFILPYLEAILGYIWLCPTASWQSWVPVADQD